MTQTAIVPPPTARELTPARWLTFALAGILLLMLASFLLAWRMDVFGIFRDPHGRELVTSEHERKAKYLLNQAYVPDNFNALVIGASASVNWHLTYFTGYRFYNESLEGGDASEQRKLVEQALPHGHFKVAIIGLFPRITAMHLLQDGFDQASRGEALGSISAYGVEYDVLRDKLQHRNSGYSPDGSHEFVSHAPPPLGLHWDNMLDPTQDPVAVADYRALVQELQARGTRVVYIVSPLFDHYLSDNRQAMDEYLASVRQTMPPAPLIDFNTPEFTAFRSDPNNFLDVVHLSAQGAETLSHMIDTQLQKVLGN